jgi:PAS domain S-box-containing protein
LWNPGLVRLHLLSDFFIAAAYFSIPFTLINFVRRRKDLPFNWMFVCFGVFIVACGLTHVMEIWTLWYPYYWLAGIIKAVTALASVPTAILLVRLVPKALKIPDADTLHAANEALIEQTKVLNLIVGNMGDGLLVVDHSGRTLLSNPAVKRMFGLEPNQMVPENCATDCAFYHNDKVTRVKPENSPMMRAMRGELVDAEEIFIRHGQDGDGGWANVTARPLRDDNGIIHGAVAVFRDVNAQKQAEAQQETLRKERAARNEAEAANKAKDKFLAVLSHELRTPLTPVLASVDLLEQQIGEEADPQSAVNVIRRNVQHEARLIDDMLDLTAITKGKMSLQFSSIDAHATLVSAHRTFSAEFRNNGVETEMHLNAEEAIVSADQARLQQLFWNLIKNAINFTPKGGKVTFRSQNEEGFVRLEIIDTGSGIAAEFLPRVFDSFEQGGRQVQGGYGGLGLGLAIAKAIVDAHNGELTVTSDGSGKGTTVAVRLPLVGSPLAPEITNGSESPTQVRAPSEAKSRRGRPLRILLVDDHKDTVRTLRLLLTRLGYEVSTAESFNDAMQIARTESFDLLVSDIGLPDGSGLDLMKEVHSLQRINGIALSGFGMEEDLQRSREAGFVDHLTKPVDLDRLQAAILSVEATLN